MRTHTCDLCSSHPKVLVLHRLPHRDHAQILMVSISLHLPYHNVDHFSCTTRHWVDAHTHTHTQSACLQQAPCITIRALKSSFHVGL